MNMCSFLLQEAYKTGYANIQGCQCSDKCVHAGNNPQSAVLAEIFNANITDAMFKVASRNDDQTRFAAVRLYVIMLAASPTSRDTKMSQGFLQLTHTLAAGKTDVAMAALLSCVGIFRAVANRSMNRVDYSIRNVMGTYGLHFEELAMVGQYRQLFDKRQGTFAGIPPGTSFRQYHFNVRNLKMKCDGCGKEEKSTDKLSGCSRCSQSFYCNADCQAKHWKAHHKTVCKQLAVLLKKNKALGWEPSSHKLMCQTCVFGLRSRFRRRHDDTPGLHQPHLVVKETLGELWESRVASVGTKVCNTVGVALFY